jgi:hypothetical protein
MNLLEKSSATLESPNTGIYRRYGTSRVYTGMYLPRISYPRYYGCHIEACVLGHNFIYLSTRACWTTSPHLSIHSLRVLIHYKFSCYCCTLSSLLSPPFDFRFGTGFSPTPMLSVGGKKQYLGHSSFVPLFDSFSNGVSEREGRERVRRELGCDFVSRAPCDSEKGNPEFLRRRALHLVKDSPKMTSFSFGPLGTFSTMTSFDATFTAV